MTHVVKDKLVADFDKMLLLLLQLFTPVPNLQHRRFRRMTYWMPKFRYASPFPQLPMDVEKEDPLTAAKRLLERICVDLENEISVFNVSTPEDEVSQS